jgi:hypothetical protein
MQQAANAVTAVTMGVVMYKIMEALAAAAAF